jgi:hypothetical protein
MKIKQVEVIVPQGSYVIGDPCYAVPDKYWMPLLESCNYFHSPIGWFSYTGYINDKNFVLAFGTKWGDGSYRGTDGREYGVDAGLIGLVPLNVVEDLSEHEGFIVTFDKDTLCIDDGSGKLKFGHITIDTDPSDTDPSDEEEDCSEDIYVEKREYNPDLYRGI